MPDVNYIDWHVHPFRADRWLEVWRPALDRAMAFGARSCVLSRNIDDPNFGVVRSQLNEPRRMQFALKLYF